MDPATGTMASLLPKLVQLLKEDYKLQTSIREDVEHLSREMESMHAAFLKMVEVPRDQLDPVVKIWANDVRELSYSTEIVLDKLLVLVPNSAGFKGLIENMGSLLKNGKTRHQIIASTIKDMKLGVLKLAHRAERYSDVLDLAGCTTTVDPRLSALYGKVSDIVGIDGGNYQELMKLLSDGDNAPNKKLKIVSVVGFGGLGKTTLVKALYDKISIDFDCKAFVPVGQNADMKKVFRDIILELSVDLYRSCSSMDAQQLIEELRKILENKRYLIVIDDIWHANLWEDIKYAFPNENNLGSRIITTTRIVSVSKVCCSSANDSVYQMEPLSDDDSKKLLCYRIFGSVRECPHELEQVSSLTLKKCGGVPLAIITMASALVGLPFEEPKDGWQVWLKYFGRDNCTEVWYNMQKILSFSYNDLPPHLKTCLLYLSAFSGTHRIEKHRLVKKLKAEGILTQETKLIGSSNIKEARLNQELSVEEEASQYLEELANRNVIHPLECSNNGEVISYHIHPMMHDLLKVIATEEKFAASLHDKEDISRAHHIHMNVRHLSIHCQNSENLIDLSGMDFDGGVQPLTVFGHAKQFLLRHFKGTRSSMAFDVGVHSLTVFGHANQSLLRHFKGARVLDLEGCKSIVRADVEYICSMVLLKQLCLAKTQITMLPPQIDNLKYLERLDVGGTQITELPPQIGDLQHLKTLDARKSRVKELPDQVVRLTGLVHLLIGDNESFKGVNLPDGIGKMISLQQVCTIDLRKCSASTLKELGELPYLKDIALVSSDEPEDTRMNDALLSSLNKSTNLRSLVVYSDFRLSRLNSSSTNAPAWYLICRKKLTVLRSLRVPRCIGKQHFLRMLDIKVCKLEYRDMAILGWRLDCRASFCELKYSQEQWYASDVMTLLNSRVSALIAECLG